MATTSPGRRVSRARRATIAVEIQGIRAQIHKTQYPKAPAVHFRIRVRIATVYLAFTALPTVVLGVLLVQQTRTVLVSLLQEMRPLLLLVPGTAHRCKGLATLINVFAEIATDASTLRQLQGFTPSLPPPVLARMIWTRMG